MNTSHLLPVITSADPVQRVIRSDLKKFLEAWGEEIDLRVQAQELKRDTAITYKRGVDKFFSWLAYKRPSAEVIRAWKADMLTQGVKPSSVNTWLAGLRSFFGWLADAGNISFNPTQAIKGASRKGSRRRHVREALTDREVQRLLAQPNRSTREGSRDYAMLCVMLYTAARGIELHRADLEDLKTLDGALVLHVQGKGHNEKDDMLILSNETESAVRDWIGKRGADNGALFTSLSNYAKGKRLSRSAIRGIIKGHMTAAGIYGRNKTTHSLRHTAITSAIRHGAPIQKVMGMSRHSNLDTLMIYFHEVDRLTDPAEKYINYSSDE